MQQDLPPKINCKSTCFIEWNIGCLATKANLHDHQSSYSPRWFLFFIFIIRMLRTFSISLKRRILQLIIIVWAHGFSGPIDAFLFSGTNWITFKHFTENAFCFTENQFPCLVCGSFYGKYEMRYKFKHLHYLDKPVIVQN